MEVSNEMLIDVALNIIGFVAAGAFVNVIYSIFMRKNKVHESPPKLEMLERTLELAHQGKMQPNSKIEFVDFRSKNNPLSKTSPIEKANAAPANRFQRNRLEIIDQVEKMLAAGRSAHKMQRKLPMSETVRGAANDQ